MVMDAPPFSSSQENLTSYLDGLNDAQKEAVLHQRGPLLVVAGAGSGKTHVVTTRISHLIQQGVSPSEILGLTFTNKAAEEMRHRVFSKSQFHVEISTFHSLGAKILRESIDHLGYPNDFTIYDEEDRLKVISACLKELGITDKKVKPKTLSSLISDAKNAFLEGANDDFSLYPSSIRDYFSKVFPLYKEKMFQFNALDFDDLIYLTALLFKKHPEVLEVYQKKYRYLHIDEYQDTNASQYEIVRLLAQKHQNLFVVGDPDQSIYSWRGADIRNILNFEKDYPNAKVVRLEQNYRSTSTILKASNQLIENNTGRLEKKLWSALGEGDPIKLGICQNEKEEALFAVSKIQQFHRKGVPFSDMVIFYRTNFQSRLFEDALLSKNIPYKIIGGISFYQRREIKDILSFLKVLKSGHDFISFSRSINLPKRGIGPATIEKIGRLSRLEGGDILDTIQVLLANPGKGDIRLSKRQKEGLADYLTLLISLRKIKSTDTVSTIVSETVRLSGYLNYLKQEDETTFQDRKENLSELVHKAKEWEKLEDEPTLDAFLEELSLKSDPLAPQAHTNDVVHLMTLHNGKGLEFELVLLTGLEEEIFPHINSMESGNELEEERRLCYVGMTRAKKHLFLTASQSRFLWGQTRYMRLSRFLKEVPRHFIQKEGAIEFFEENSNQEELSSGKGEFFKGDFVFHPKFGSGVVTDVYEGSLGLTYDILFGDSPEPVSVVAKFGKLQKLTIS